MTENSFLIVSTYMRAYGLVAEHVIRIDETAVRFRLGPFRIVVIIPQSSDLFSAES